MWGLSQRSRSIVSPGRAQLIRGCRNSTRELVTRGTGCLTWGLKLEKVVKGVQTLWRQKLTHELGWLREQRCSESPLKNACVHAQSVTQSCPILCNQKVQLGYCMGKRGKGWEGWDRAGRAFDKHLPWGHSFMYQTPSHSMPPPPRKPQVLLLRF